MEKRNMINICPGFSGCCWSETQNVNFIGGFSFGGLVEFAQCKVSYQTTRIRMSPTVENEILSKVAANSMSGFRLWSLPSCTPFIGLSENSPELSWRSLEQFPLKIPTVNGRNIKTPSIRYNRSTPLPPKFSVNVTCNALAPMDEKKSNP